MIVSERSQRMVDSAPDYYQYSNTYGEIQGAIAEDLNGVDLNNEDIKKQLRILTATWGLKYWEFRLGIPINEADSYEVRRSRVLSKWRSPGNFSADLIRSVAEAFSGGEVEVRVDIPAYQVYIKFVGARGIPENLDDLKAQIENIIHAHLGTEYEFTYLRYSELDAANKTWSQIDALNMTWEEFETWKPV
jgi:hypothetical protein